MFLDTFSILNDLFYQILTFFENVAFGLVGEKGLLGWKNSFFQAILRCCERDNWLPEPVFLCG